MPILRRGALALLLSAAATGPASAAVTYALSGTVLVGYDATGAAVLLPQQLQFTVDAPLTMSRDFATSALTTCDPGAPFVCAGAAFALAGDTAAGASPFFSTLAIGGRLPTTPEGTLDIVVPYNFDPAAFGANGSYATALASPGQGTLTVSGIAVAPIPAVPELAAWTMMVAGFGAVGFAMRVRPRRVAVRFG